MTQEHSGHVADRLLSVDDLDPLGIEGPEADRIREAVARLGMSTEHGVDPETSVIHRLEEIAGERDRVAVSDGSTELTYGGLVDAARRTATLLERDGITAGDVVAVGGRRSAAVVAAFLAIELLGAVYTPVDAAWPAGRVEQVLTQAGAAVLLVAGPDGPGEAAADGARAAGVPTRSAGDAADLAPRPHPKPRCDPREPRYILFTSGSTGTPKGAVIEQQGMVNHLYAKIVAFGFTESDVMAMTSPLSFDVSVWQMLCLLLAGGRVVIVPDDTGFDPRRLQDAIAADGVTVLEVVPTFLRHVVDDLAADAPRVMAPLRWMICNGEELPRELARRWLQANPSARLVNAYGPTECSDDVTHHVVTSEELARERVPIGSPIVNARLYVLRETGGRWSACAPGETGELFIGGVCVGRGYVGNEARTRAAFFRDPFDPDGPTGRLYRTGDAVTILEPREPGGPRVLQWVDRIDRQVKMGGARLEPGEIEAVLQQYPGIAAAAVMVLDA